MGPLPHRRPTSPRGRAVPDGDRAARPTGRPRRARGPDPRGRSAFRRSLEDPLRAPRARGDREEHAPPPRPGARDAIFGQRACRAGLLAPRRDLRRGRHPRLRDPRRDVGGARADARERQDRRARSRDRRVAGHPRSRADPFAARPARTIPPSLAPLTQADASARSSRRADLPPRRGRGKGRRRGRAPEGARVAPRRPRRPAMRGRVPAPLSQEAVRAPAAGRLGAAPDDGAPRGAHRGRGVAPVASRRGSRRPSRGPRPRPALPRRANTRRRAGRVGCPRPRFAARLRRR